MTSKHEHRFCSGSSTWKSGSCLQMPSSCLLLKAPKWAKSKLKSVEQNVPYLAASAAKYYKKGAVNPLAASAASPDYLKFNVLFKVLGGLVPRFVSLSRKLRFWFSDATFRRPSQQKAKILVLRCSFWSTVSAF